MFLGGRVATCAIVDLEVLMTARDATEHEEMWFERQLLPRAPIDEACTRRAVDVQGKLITLKRHRVSISDLIIAAAAEQAGLTVLHYDRGFDVIAEVTGQLTEWVVPQGTVP